MDRAALPVESMDALELRVLQGPQSGARAPLTVGAPCVLAAGPDGADSGSGADIVLREPALAPTRVRVSADTPHAILEVLQGEVQLGDDTLGAGAQALWPMHAPLRLGTLVLAFGRAVLDDWPAATDAPAAAAASPGDAPSTAAATPLRRRAEVWLAAMGAGVLVVCGAALWIAHASAAPVAVASPDIASLSTALRSSEFAALQMVRGGDGQLVLRGRLPTDAARQKLDAWLLDLGVQARIDVVVDETVAREVAEVFRVNGVAVKASVAAPGRIDAVAAERDADRLARAEEVVRRDVRGLEQLSVRNTAKPLPPPAPPVFDDPGKRIASLITAEPAYIVTADGSRYFLGALLPSGHRVTHINPGSVTIELHGQQTTLNF